MAKYKVTVCRISYSFTDIEVEAESVEAARNEAWNDAGNHEYSEKSAEYEPQEVIKLD